MTSRLSESLLRRLVDAHVHCSPSTNIDSLQKMVQETYVGRLTVMGTSPSVDWEVVAKLARLNRSRIIPSFGIHPWQSSSSDSFIDHDGKLNSNLILRFKDLLNEFPNAWVGEIGLDRVAVDRKRMEMDKATNVHNLIKIKPKLYPFDTQIVLFREQLKIAVEYDRIVSVHMVKYMGGLVDLFYNRNTFFNDSNFKLPRRFVLHSFVSKEDTIRLLLNSPNSEKLYFSFSYILMNKVSWFSSVLKLIPDDRILIETDYESLNDTDNGISNIVILISEIKQWSLEKTVDILLQNFNKLIEK